MAKKVKSVSEEHFSIQYAQVRLFRDKINILNVYFLPEQIHFQKVSQMIFQVIKMLWSCIKRFSKSLIFDGSSKWSTAIR